jgi:hypothetical protein
MVSIAALWLPIVLSAVIVFVVSALMHMLLKYHQSDCLQIPNEDKVLAMLRSVNLKRGFYYFPYILPKDMKAPASIERYKQGPVGYMTIIPSGAPAMPKYLIQWFIYCLVIGAVVAYLAGSVLPVGAPYMPVFHVVGIAASLAYGLGHLSNGIWKGQTWSMTLKEVIDGIVFGLLTAGTFGWLWPR